MYYATNYYRYQNCDAPKTYSAEYIYFVGQADLYDEDRERTLLDIISGSYIDDPEDLIIHKENFTFMEEEMNKVLSPFEKEVLALVFRWSILSRNF